MKAQKEHFAINLRLGVIFISIMLFQNGYGQDLSKTDSLEREFSNSWFAATTFSYFNTKTDDQGFIFSLLCIIDKGGNVKSLQLSKNAPFSFKTDLPGIREKLNYSYFKKEAVTISGNKRETNFIIPVYYFSTDHNNALKLYKTSAEKMKDLFSFDNFKQQSVIMLDPIVIFTNPVIRN